MAKPQMIIVISPHSSLYENAFSANANTNFTATFEEFGDLSTKKDWVGAPNFAAKLSHKCKLNDLDFQLVSRDKLDHGASVPLFYLANHLKDIKILPIGYSKQKAVEHIRFGEVLKEVIMEDENRIAIIASGDLSHNISQHKEAGETFDEKLIYLIKQRATASMIDLDSSDLLKNTEECGYRSILILMGILKKMNYKFEETYEHPFDIGYLTGGFNLG